MVFAFVKLLAVALATSDANLLTKPATLEKEIRLEKALGALIGRRLASEANGEVKVTVQEKPADDTDWGLEEFGAAWGAVKAIYHEIVARISGGDCEPKEQKQEPNCISFKSFFGNLIMSSASGCWELVKTLFNTIVGLFQSKDKAQN